jgi:hypothetical protein
MIETEEKRNPSISKGRGKDTLFRVTVRNQIDQISIADNKANMIISINTIIVTIVVTILGSGSVIQGTESFIQLTQIIVPLTLLMVACLISAVYAILAARPRIINKGLSDGKGSMLFFGNYKDMPLDDYLNMMEDILGSNTTIYRNLVIDMYNYGQILSRKYKLLWLSYTFFLAGMVLCVISYFIVIMFTTPYANG